MERKIVDALLEMKQQIGGMDVRFGNLETKIESIAERLGNLIDFCRDIVHALEQEAPDKVIRAKPHDLCV